MRLRLREKEEIIGELEAKISKQCDAGDCNINARIFKKVEHLNAEVEKRLEKVHEHYESKWRAKSEDFINEIADHKHRINVLIEEKEELLKKMSRNSGENDCCSKQVTYYKQIIVKKDCDMEEWRQKIKEYEEQVY